MIQRTRLERMWYWHKESIITLAVLSVVICGVVIFFATLPPDPLTIATTNHDCKGIRAYAEQHISDKDDFEQAEKAMKLEGCM